MTHDETVRQTCMSMVRAHGRHWGCPEIADAIILTIRDTNRRQLTIARADASRNFDVAEEIEHHSWESGPTRDGRKVVARKSFEAIRAALRRRSLRQAGEADDAMPAWSMTMPAMQLAVIRAAGIDPADHLPDVVSMREAMAATPWTGSFVNTEGDFRSLHMEARIDEEDRYVSMEWDWKPRVRLRGFGFPLMVVQSLVGQDLMAVLGLDGMPHVPVIRIGRAEDNSIGSRQTVEIGAGSRLETLAPAPRGVDRTWLKVPRILEDPAF